MFDEEGSVCGRGGGGVGCLRRGMLWERRGGEGRGVLGQECCWKVKQFLPMDVVGVYTGSLAQWCCKVGTFSLQYA